jgi:hypothetical protein
MQDTPQTPPVKFDLAFTPKIDEYIASTDKPTVKGFATLIGTDLYSVWAWARKKKKDDKGNVTEEFARPQFKAALEKLEALEKSQQDDKLNPKQELFCQLYATDREFFGNGTQTYIEVYEPDQHKPNWYKSAQASASRLLSNVIICKRINELLEDEGLNDAFVDKQLLFIITQHDDKSSKVAAIREYNKLKQRITEKIDHSSKGERIGTVIGFNYLSPATVDESNNPDNQTNA